MEVEFVCLANSRLQNGRSIAGLRTDGGGWVRIVGKNGPLGRSIYTMEGGKEVGLLDVVRAQTTGPQPVNNQPENYVATGPRPGVMGAGLNALLAGIPQIKPTFLDIAPSG
ncbi:MAG: hypothetical protein O2913_06960, partial [Chloroflexi bacterium]|nr:hypothetical protein [Chloroflexota bacterium]